ncbi:MAG: exodeoxyribonuclease I, partial [Xanthomonadales bacterium]|nr:exodeoxyribonuclease I [Xanthomonadales bacterium]
VFDLMTDPEPLLKLDADEISDRLFTSADDLPDDVERIALKSIHTNHVPMIAPARTLQGVDCQRIGLDPEHCYRNAEKLLAALPRLRGKLMDVFAPLPPGGETDPDHMIYSGGFFSNADRKLMAKVHATQPEELAKLQWPFQDARLKEMLFRYRARNYPATLDAQEHQRWQQQRLARLLNPTDDRQLTPDRYRLEIEAAREQNPNDHRAQRILDQLEAWGEEICRADHL